MHILVFRIIAPFFQSFLIPDATPILLATSCGKERFAKCILQPNLLIDAFSANAQHPYDRIMGTSCVYILLTILYI